MGALPNDQDAGARREVEEPAGAGADPLRAESSEQAANQATAPPGNGDLDQDAVDRGRDKLDQAGH